MSYSSSSTPLSEKACVSLKDVQASFRQWRQNPNKSSRIPNKLWEQVIEVLEYNSKSKVLKLLGISYKQLARYLQCHAQPSKSSIGFDTALKQDTQIPTFIKAVVSGPIPPTASISCYDVKLTRPNGSALQIQQVTRVDILKLVDQFVGEKS